MGQVPAMCLGVRGPSGRIASAGKQVLSTLGLLKKDYDKWLTVHDKNSEKLNITLWAILANQQHNGSMCFVWTICMQENTCAGKPEDLKYARIFALLLLI